MHHIQEPHEQQIITLSLLVIRTAQFPSKTNSQEMTPKLAELILKGKFMWDTFIMEHPVKSRNWFLKHLWKNETKILFCSRDSRFWRFWKVLVLRLLNCLDTRQRLKYMTHHTWQFFFSKAVCQPSFSYIMNHGNSTQIVFGKSWWSLKRFE